MNAARLQPNQGSAGIRACRIADILVGTPAIPENALRAT